jgi:hypothetical protein
MKPSEQIEKIAKDLVERAESLNRRLRNRDETVTAELFDRKVILQNVMDHELTERYNIIQLSETISDWIPVAILRYLDERSEDGNKK